MKLAWRWMVVLTLVVVLLGDFAYSRRFVIAAKLWHWKHGNIAIIGPYELPVANEWLVSDEKPDSVLLINTKKPIRSGTRGFHSNATVIASSLRSSPVDLAFWLTSEQQRLANQGVHTIERRTVQLVNEQVVCIGGTELRDVVQIPNVPTISLQCRSSGTLSLIFTGQQSEVENFYSLVSGITKRR